MTSEQDRDTFRQIVAEAVALTKAGDADGANAEVNKIEQLVAAKTDPETFLLPLTDASEDLDVRYNAGAALLHLGHADAGLRVLDSVAEADSGTASARAKVVTRTWRRRNAQGDPI